MSDSDVKGYLVILRFEPQTYEGLPPVNLHLCWLTARSGAEAVGMAIERIPEHLKGQVFAGHSATMIPAELCPLNEGKSDD